MLVDHMSYLPSSKESVVLLCAVLFDTDSSSAVYMLVEKLFSMQTQWSPQAKSSQQNLFVPQSLAIS